MLYFPLSALVNGITSITLGFFVYFILTRKNKKYLSFVLFCLSIATWSFPYIAWQFSNNAEEALFWSRILMIGVIFIPITFLHFTFDFLGSEQSLKRRFLLFAYFLGFILLFADVTPLMVIGVEQRLFFKFWPIPGKLFHLSPISFTGFILYSLFLLFNSYSRAYGIKRIQIKIITWGIVIGCIGGMSNFLLWYNIPIAPVTNILVSVFIIMVAYGILQHKLMDIEIVIKKTLVYSILILIITILYFIIVFLFERLFSFIVGYKSTALTLGIIALFSIIFNPLKNKIQFMIDKYFFRGSIDQIEKEKELLETELQRSERLKTISTLAAGMAHEIKNPLTSIKTFVEYIDEKKNDPVFINKLKTIVPKEIDKIANIINQLLDYSRTEKVSQKECDIHCILDYVLDLYNSTFLNKHIKLQKQYNSQFPKITCDENQLKQTFINIILNSIESMPIGGDVVVKTEDVNNVLEISIKDTGIGIPKEKIKHLFDPFYTTKEKGTGLGLFIVHQIIRNNKGRIGIDSEINKGTVVKVRFETK